MERGYLLPEYMTRDHIVINKYRLFRFAAPCGSQRCYTAGSRPHWCQLRAQRSPRGSRGSAGEIGKPGYTGKRAQVPPRV